ncbi:MAG: hypothetical protein GF331_22545 [Chitinivibrionales bacterium]|nr:hypothetical protein [Chitinivibrionales bacterium]
MYTNIRCTAPTQRTAVVDSAVALLERTMMERGNVQVVREGEAEMRLTLAIESGIGAEGFSIRCNGPDVHVAGNDDRGLLYGVGAFLRQCAFAENGFAYSGWAGTRVPQMPVRGIYFATHFHNFYHDAPVEEVVRYVEELSLWGCNALMVWFDMHHYTGIDDPDAAAMIARLRTILRAANSVGMGAGILVLGNEGYSTSPVELREKDAPMAYQVELCPSKPGGMKLILKWHREVLEQFADINVEYVCLWPHDQGGCGCEQCRPWGGRGFVEVTRAMRPLVREMFPQAKLIVSTWCFDYEMDGEFEGMWRALREDASLVDYVMADGHTEFPAYVVEHAGDVATPILDFPEISMTGMLPWGGFGLNPLPQYIQGMWESSRHLLCGGFPYSEGIYEDVNKAIMLQLYWDPRRPIRDIVREYVAGEWSHSHAEALTDTLMRLGEGSGWEPARELQVPVFAAVPAQLPDNAPPPYDTVCYECPPIDASAQNAEAVSAAEASLPSRISSSWRWRCLQLRVAIERELRLSGGRPTPQSDEYFDELCDIYHAGQAESAVKPAHSRLIAGLVAAARARDCA